MRKNENTGTKKKKIFGLLFLYPCIFYHWIRLSSVGEIMAK